MSEQEIATNVRVMGEMFPEFIKAYAAAAQRGHLDRWAKAVHSGH